MCTFLKFNYWPSKVKHLGTSAVDFHYYLERKVGLTKKKKEHTRQIVTEDAFSVPTVTLKLLRLFFGNCRYFIFLVLRLRHEINASDANFIWKMVQILSLLLHIL